MAVVSWTIEEEEEVRQREEAEERERGREPKKNVSSLRASMSIHWLMWLVFKIFEKLEDQNIGHLA